MKPIRTYEIAVPGFPAVKYVARSPAKARVRCFRDYQIVDDRCSFKEFLRRHRLAVVPNDEETGERVLIGGELVTRVSTWPNGGNVAFMRDGDDHILFSHPNDVKPAPPTPRIAIDIACNDPDNGLFAGRAEQINIKDADGELIEFEARRCVPPKIEEVTGGIRVAGRFWPILGSKDWVGNWCWNAYWVELDTALKFLAWLHKRGFFGLTCGDARIFERWKDASPFAGADHAFIADLLTKPTPVGAAS